MEYPLENLGPERFQRVCQALLAKEFPSARLLPVSQPDGGRDAFFHRAPTKGRNREFVVFQVKYARDPAALDDPREWVLDAMDREAKNISRLAERGATHYRLVTNVRGSAHRDTGSIDKLDTALADLPLPADGWWRDDLLGRLDEAWNIKWAFPELLTGPDMLRAVIEHGLGEEVERRASAIRAFLAEQSEDDARVKFKQVELENRLLDLFVDVPLVTRYSTAPRKRRVAALIHFIGRETASVGASEWGELQDDLAWATDQEATTGAALFFLNEATPEVAPWVVLEGAPGQGKSTVSQYICQIHRLRLLGRETELAGLPSSYITGPLRLPFRVDLRDLAAWLHGRNPFGDVEVDSLPTRRTLETFLAAQIETSSGGAAFSVSDLHAVARVSSLLVVLDGLDEVADIDERRRVVSEVSSAVGRLRPIATAMQVVITSRPAAFENSPGFSEERFVYCELTSLTADAIFDYANRWIKARGLPSREAADVRKVLKEKLSQPHMRELARNPMQLAILLSLIHRRGPSLPDKRTALYDSYINTFFDREAEKTDTVQLHRDLLIELHQFLAWTLQTDAERGNSQGSIEEDRLREVLRLYLQREEKDTALVETLFRSLVERVVAIVSRVQGTYEFEVQPLREYFAARYLYDTAPYSPAGAEAAGDKTDRFDALARNFYWLNVTRFFAGCASKGELPSLVERLQELTEEEGFRETDQPRVLASMLLSDWVFAQRPRSMKAVVEIVLDDLASRAHHDVGRAPLTLPEGSGRAELADRCWELCSRKFKWDRTLMIAETLRSNEEPRETDRKWLIEAAKSRGRNREKWLRIGLWTGSLARASQDSLIDLLGDDPTNPARCQLLFSAKRGDLADRDDKVARRLIKAILDGRLSMRYANHRPNGAVEALAQAVGMMPEVAFREPLGIRRSLWRWWRDEYEHVPSESSLPAVKQCWVVLDTLHEQLHGDGSDWMTSLAPWNDFVEAIRREWGEQWTPRELAIVGAGVRASDEQGSLGEGLFDESHPLCQRARYARMRAGGGNWWALQLEEAGGRLDQAFIAALFFAWASPKTILGTITAFDQVIARARSQELNCIRNAVHRATHFQAGDSSRAMRLDISALPDSLDPYTVLLLGTRMRRDEAAKVFDRYLTSYEGSDAVVLHARALHLLAAVDRDSSLWPSLLDAIRTAYGVGAAVRLSDQRHFRASGQRTVPVDLARKVLADAVSYPLDAVAMAEAACRADLGSSLVPLSEVAERDSWDWV